MSLSETKELTQFMKANIFPIEHSGGDGWTILHGDTLKVISECKPEVFDAVITDPPYASGGRSQAEKNRTTNQKYSSMDKENALPDFEGDQMDQRSWNHVDDGLAPCGKKSIQTGSAYLPVHRLAAVSLHYRRPAKGRLALARLCRMG